MKFPHEFSKSRILSWKENTVAKLEFCNQKIFKFYEIAKNMLIFHFKAHAVAFDILYCPEYLEAHTVPKSCHSWLSYDLIRFKNS